MELLAFIYGFLSDALLTSLLSEEPSYFKHQKSEKYHDFMVPNGARYAFGLSYISISNVDINSRVSACDVRQTPCSRKEF